MQTLLGTMRTVKYYAVQLTTSRYNTELTKTLVDPADARSERAKEVLDLLERAEPTANYSEREARNSSWGSSGEEFVMGFERQRPTMLGADRFVDRVEHVSATKGDGLGFDVRSFDDGSDRFIKVKTTRDGIDTPFFVSRDELRVCLSSFPASVTSTASSTCMVPRSCTCSLGRLPRLVAWSQPSTQQFSGGSEPTSAERSDVPSKDSSAIISHSQRVSTFHPDASSSCVLRASRSRLSANFASQNS